MMARTRMSHGVTYVNADSILLFGSVERNLEYLPSFLHLQCLVSAARGRTARIGLSTFVLAGQLVDKFDVLLLSFVLKPKVSVKRESRRTEQFTCDIEPKALHAFHLALPTKSIADGFLVLFSPILPCNGMTHWLHSGGTRTRLVVLPSSAFPARKNPHVLTCLNKAYNFNAVSCPGFSDNFFTRSAADSNCAFILDADEKLKECNHSADRIDRLGHAYLR